MVTAQMRTVRLHDTRTGELVELRPRDGRKVGIYACGPTVYGRIHVGNARPYVVFSLFKRFLAHEGYEPVLVANITDINDKIYDAARPAGRPSAELATEMTQHYLADTERLGIGRPDHEPQATLMVGEIVELIRELIDRGHAYVVEGDVYFRVRSLPEYGELSHRDVDQMDQGEGVEGAGRKEDPLDFALWKARKPMEDTWWDAPWGEGRPGWHIECSAMAEATLGSPFEIHGGGNDLIFPHHENEAAQTLAARGHELAQIWMHNGMLELGADATSSPPPLESKMSKSVGNVRGLAEVLDEVGRDTLLMYFAEGHYRQPLAFSPEKLDDAARRVEGIRNAGRRLVPGPSPDALVRHRDAFFDALADDYNTPRALAALAEWIREANSADAPVGDAHAREMLAMLGLENLLERDEAAPAEIVELADRRGAARAARDFAEADRIRERLSAEGVTLEDGAEGTRWRRAG
jgi:cysteinyl-tRNA synthetase